MLSYEQQVPTMPNPHAASQPSPIKHAERSDSVPAASLEPDKHKHIWIITGPAGCGKSTVAQYLANQLSLHYIEGDEFHPPSNIAKMAAGIPLTDADRWDWLILLRQQALIQLAHPLTSTIPNGVVLTCSALKRKYRDVIRVAAYNDSQVRVHFVYLRASEELLLKRVSARKGHYMKDDMVKSQFDSLEEPTPDEADCLVVRVDGTMPEVQTLALDAVHMALNTTAVEETAT